MSIANALISDLIAAWYIADGTKHLRLYYREAPFIVFSSRPGLRTIERNRADDSAVNVGF